MDFMDALKQFSARAAKMKNNIQTEEATKTSLIMPFFSLLGYDVFNPDEFTPEYIADVGIKKGEKVDYAIMQQGKPMILIEAKWCGEDLSKYDSQLFRYFGTSHAKFAILTNGILYNFYTDLDSPNRMDEKPFLSIDLLNIRDNQIPEIKKFSKSSFDVDTILNSASELKYSNEFKIVMARELQEPSDEFTRLFLSRAYSGRLMQSIIDRFKPVLKKALNNYINELMNDKIKSALQRGEEAEPIENGGEQQDHEVNTRENLIVTTPEELEAYFIVKNLLKEIAPIQDITYRDTVSYINILYKNNGRNWICRLILKDSQKTLIIPDADKNQTKYALETIYDLEQYKDQLLEVLNRYL